MARTTRASVRKPKRTLPLQEASSSPTPARSMLTLLPRRVLDAMRQLELSSKRSRSNDKEIMATFHKIVFGLDSLEAVRAVHRKIGQPMHSFLRTAIYNLNGTCPPTKQKGKKRGVADDSTLDTLMRWFDREEGGKGARGPGSDREWEGVDVVFLLGLFGEESIKSRRFLIALRHVARLCHDFDEAWEAITKASDEMVEEGAKGASAARPFPPIVIEEVERIFRSSIADESLNDESELKAESRSNLVPDPPATPQDARKIPNIEDEDSSGDHTDASQISDDGNDSIEHGHFISPELGRYGEDALEDSVSEAIACSIDDSTTLGLKTPRPPPSPLQPQSSLSETASQCHTPIRAPVPSFKHASVSDLLISLSTLDLDSPASADSLPCSPPSGLPDYKHEKYRSTSANPDSEATEQSQHLAETRGRDLLTPSSFLAVLRLLDPAPDRTLHTLEFPANFGVYELVILPFTLSSQSQWVLAFIRPPSCRIQILCARPASASSFEWLGCMCADTHPSPSAPWRLSVEDMPCSTPPPPIADGDLSMLILVRSLFWMHGVSFTGPFDADLWRRIFASLFMDSFDDVGTMVVRFVGTNADTMAAFNRQLDQVGGFVAKCVHLSSARQGDESQASGKATDDVDIKQPNQGRTTVALAAMSLRIVIERAHLQRMLSLLE